MAEDKSEDEGGEVVFPRPAGKRINTEDMSSESENEDGVKIEDEPQDEFESEDEDDEAEGSGDDEDEFNDDDDDDELGSGSDSDGEERSSSGKVTTDDTNIKKEKKEKRKRNREKSHKPPKSKKSRYGSIFLEEAEVGSDDEEDDDVVRDEQPMDSELRAIKEEAERRAAERHEANRRFQETSVADVVADIENRFRRQKASASQMGGYLGSAEGYMAETTRRSLVPGVNDPGIFMVRVKTGMEKNLVKSILLKSIDSQRRGQKLQIKSVFCTSTPGYIYVEAMNEPFAREAITGLNGIYYSTLKQVPIPEMSQLLTLTVKKKPIKEGQWCRMRRGPNKGDLARVLRMLEGGTRALIQVVPRPDYSLGTRKGGSSGAARPLQRLFRAEEAKNKGHEVERKRHPVTGEFSEFWNNEYYNNRGYLIKEVKVETYLTHATDPLPRLEEMTLFQEKKDDDEDDDSDGDGGGGSKWNSKQGIMRELAKIEEESGTNADSNVPFRPGDTVQVMEGEQRNLRGVIVSINDRTGQAVVQPLSEYQLGNLTVETSLLMKYIRPGAHVKVLQGKHMSQTGRVVSVYRSDGDNVAAILTDGINQEITVNIGHLQVTNEVTTGLNSLGGYELYDLLILNANDYGVVVFVGTEHLKVLNLNNIIKEVRPMEVKGKKVPSRGATGAFDHMKNPLSIGDTVSVVEGIYAKKSGTIKHIHRSVLWLHSTSHLQNSGIFVVKGKSCLLAGSKLKGNSNTAATLLNASFNTDQQPGATLIRTQAFRRGKGGQDDDHGKAVKLTKGGYKGHLGRIVDSTNTHFSVELHGQLKVVNVMKSKVKFVDGDMPTLGDSYQPGRDGGVGGGLIPTTPFLTAQTPQHFAGSETPGLYGGMTPNPHETPGRESSIWNASTVLDVANNSLSQQELSGASPMSTDNGGWSNSSGWGAGVDSGGGWGDSWSMPETNVHNEYMPTSSSQDDRKKGVSVEYWDVEMIVTFADGEHVGKYAIIVEKPSLNGTVKLRMRESSSSGRNSEHNVPFFENVSKVRIVEPRKRDVVKVVYGAHEGVVSKIKAIIGDDVYLADFPDNVFKMDQVAWLHTRT